MVEAPGPGSLLVLVVTYNEGENIARLVEHILAQVPHASVLVVDDDSPDGTSDIVRAIVDPRVRLECRTGVRGYSSAMIAGLRMAMREGYAQVATLDADVSHNPADLPGLVEALREADVAVGSRYCGGVRVLNWSIRRLLLSLAANAYVRALSGLASTDCTSGFRAYRVSALRGVRLERISATGYAFLPEVLFALRAAVIVDVPICFTERRAGVSKMSGAIIAEALLRPWGLLFRRLMDRLKPTH